MSHDHDDRQLDRLLARGRLARPEQERILEAVLAASAPKPRPRRLWLALPALASLALAAGVVALVLRAPGSSDPAATSPSPHATDPAGELRVRGAGGAPSIRAGCEGPCRPGALVMFEIDGLTERAHVAAWAVGPDGGRTWYFPSTGQPAPAVPPSAGPQVLAQGVRLGPEHVAGVYTLQLLLVRAPLERDVLVALTEGRGPRELLIAQRTQPLELAP
jgi:hypothetical protein